ncbi:50S ribosomal protein L15 [Candidatus Woesearchaeota archaeon]|nr:50S ribosomal protein L15 [Candidatus Woesearchaeota archaeon]
MKRKKNSRQRGTKTHGWGSMKKHRGKGNKGGAGKAGTGKRGDAKKPSYWKEKYFGKFGFTSIKKKISSINLDDLQQQLEKLVQLKKVSKEAETFIIDLAQVGYGKLLGRGKVLHTMKITVQATSEKAIVRVKEHGGEVIVK